MNLLTLLAIVGAILVTLVGVNLFLDTEPKIQSEKGRKVFLTFFTTSYLALLLGLGSVLVNAN